MKWNPELQPGEGASERTKMEWAIRSFRKISEWTASHLSRGEDPHPQYAKEGYGGIYLSAPYSTTIALTTSWQIIGGAAYDSELSPTPVGVTQDAAAGTITVEESGIWTVYASVIADIIPVTANASNTVELTIYDTVAGAPGDQPITFTVPRYGESINPSLAVPVRITGADVGNPFALAIRTRSATPAITVIDIVSVDFHAVRVAVES